MSEPNSYPDTPEKILARLEAGSWDSTLIAETAKLLRATQAKLAQWEIEAKRQSDINYELKAKLEEAERDNALYAQTLIEDSRERVAALNRALEAESALARATDCVAVLRELDRLYRLRFEIAAREKVGVDCKAELSKYGHEKKRAWEQSALTIAAIDAAMSSGGAG